MHATNASATDAEATARRNERTAMDMKDDKGKTVFRAALAFGIIAATIEMGVLLWMMYC